MTNKTLLDLPTNLKFLTEVNYEQKTSVKSEFKENPTVKRKKGNIVISVLKKNALHAPSDVKIIINVQ